ncbi:MAG: cupin domain-containing protein [Acidobacteriota bacterium]|nr:cupin domain-containing protein [Acidobacteriota bacterium]MDQ7086979.1 cupin domain-containing protein [Acidobacteriota bacterium]
MLVRNVDRTPAEPMELEGAREVTLRMMISRRDGAPNFALRHFTVGVGGHTPRHRHDYEHENYIISGRGTVEADGEVREIGAGDVVLVPPGALHQYVNTHPREPLVMLCLVPTTFDSGEGPCPVPGS